MKSIFTLMVLLCLINMASPNPVYSQEDFIKAKGPVGCALTKNITVDALVDEAGIIFKGKFMDFRLVEENGIQVRRLKFLVQENIQGLDSNKKTLFLDEWARSRSMFSEKLIAEEETYVFFFHSPSDKGLTSLVGAEQGAVKVEAQSQLKFSPRLSLKAKEKKSLFSFLLKPKAVELDTYQDLKEFCNKKG